MATNRQRPYESVAADIRAQIMAGDLPARSTLPSISKLAERYGFTNTTIQKALSMLENEGFVTGQQGKGVFVRDKQPFVIDVGTYFEPSTSGYSYELLKVAEVASPVEVAEAFELDPGDSVVLRRRLLRHDGTPVEVDQSYYPLAIVEGSDLTKSRRVRGGAPQVLEELGYPQERFVDAVSARMPTAEEIELLGLPDVPVIRQFRITYSRDNRAVEASIMVKGSHLYELRYHQTA